MRLPRAILVGCAAVAVLDGLEPVIFYGLRGVHPMRIFQGIAAGLLGRASFGGGLPTALLGMCLHAFIASMVVITYWLVSQRVPVLTRRPVVCGVLYGLVVYAVMTFVVVPLSAAGSGSIVPRLPVMLNGIMAHVLFVGPPSAFAARAATSAQSMHRTKPRATGGLV